jgi:hypothetical protein
MAICVADIGYAVARNHPITRFVGRSDSKSRVSFVLAQRLP